MKKAELTTFYDVWKTQPHIYYLGDEGTMTMVQILPNGVLLHPELTSEEQKELDIRIHLDVLLSKSTSNQREFEALKSIPD